MHDVVELGIEREPGLQPVQDFPGSAREPVFIESARQPDDMGAVPGGSEPLQRRTDIAQLAIDNRNQRAWSAPMRRSCSAAWASARNHRGVRIAGRCNLAFCSSRSAENSRIVSSMVTRNVAPGTGDARIRLLSISELMP